MGKGEKSSRNDHCLETVRGKSKFCCERFGVSKCVCEMGPPSSATLDSPTESGWVLGMWGWGWDGQSSYAQEYRGSGGWAPVPPVPAWAPRGSGSPNSPAAPHVG